MAHLRDDETVAQDGYENAWTCHLVYVRLAPPSRAEPRNLAISRSDDTLDHPPVDITALSATITQLPLLREVGLNIEPVAGFANDLLRVLGQHSKRLESLQLGGGLGSRDVDLAPALDSQVWANLRSLRLAMLGNLAPILTPLSHQLKSIDTLELMVWERHPPFMSPSWAPSARSFPPSPWYSPNSLILTPPLSPINWRPTSKDSSFLDSSIRSS